jgi:hypothetical protein
VTRRKRPLRTSGLISKRFLGIVAVLEPSEVVLEQLPVIVVDLVAFAGRRVRAIDHNASSVRD